MSNERLLKSARESICIQAESIKFLENQINSDFADLCKKILKILDMSDFQRKRYINYCYNFSKKYKIQKIIPFWKRVFNS